MWIPRQVLLFLALVLIPRPGVSQIGAQRNRLCRDCAELGSMEDKDIFQYYTDGKVEKYTICPHSETIRFQLRDVRKGTCVDKYAAWVKQLRQCVDKAKDSGMAFVRCEFVEIMEKRLEESSKDTFKGTNEKPPTTTIKAPTTGLVTSMKPSTQSRDPKLGQDTEPPEMGKDTPSESPVVRSGSDTTKPGFNKANINLRQGNDISSKDPKDEHHDGKMQNMRNAIISLIAIILVMVAVGLGVYCRKKKTNPFKTPCGSDSIPYTNAPSEDSILENCDTSKELHCEVIKTCG